MATPTTQLSRSRPDIAESFEEFDVEANANAMICTKLLPVFESNVQAGNFGRIPIEQMLETADVERASGSGYSRGNWEFEDVYFATKDYGREEPVDDRDARIYSDYFDAEVMAGKRARSTVLVEAEKRCAANTIDNGSINTTAAGTVWSTAASATPIANVNTAVLAVWGRTGVWPNALVLSYELFRYLRQVDEVLDRIESSGAGDQTRARDVTTQQIAEVMDLDYVLVAGASENTAQKGQSATVAQIWNRTKCLVTRIPTSQDLREPCLGRTFHWGQDGSAVGTIVESYRDETVRADIIRARHEVEEKIIYPEIAQVITGCLA
jgi:hypothetical protein